MHALVDGLTLNAVLQPEGTGPEEMRTVLRRHIGELAGVPAEDGRGARWERPRRCRSAGAARFRTSFSSRRAR